LAPISLRAARRTGTQNSPVSAPFARGSASELEYHLLLAKDLQFLPESLHERLAADTIEIKRMLTALIQS